MEGLKIYDEYQKYGVENYYKKFSKTYNNPHEERIKKVYVEHIGPLIGLTDKILDIATGSGLMCKLVNSYNGNYNIQGTDPYFSNKYCNMKLSFEDIASGMLSKEYDTAICCYAYHLMDESWRYDFLSSLALSVKKFIIVSPSKKININHPMWSIVKYIREEKVTLIILEAVIG
jgi:hypothetical protein